MHEEFQNFQSSLGEGLTCPSCENRKIPIAPPGALTVTKCASCGQVVAQFIYITAKVDKNIIQYGTEEEKKMHIIEVLTNEVSRRFRKKLEENLLGTANSVGPRPETELDLMLKLPYAHTSIREIEDHYINLSLRLTDLTKQGIERPDSLIREYELYKQVYEKLRSMEKDENSR